MIHTLIIDFFSHGLRSVKIEQELEKHLFCGVLVSVITMRANQRLQKSIYYFSTKHAIHLEEIARTRWFSQDNVSEWRFLSSCIHSAIKKRGLKRGVASFEVDSLTLF